MALVGTSGQKKCQVKCLRVLSLADGGMVRGFEIMGHLNYQLANTHPANIQKLRYNQFSVSSSHVSLVTILI